MTICEKIVCLKNATFSQSGYLTSDYLISVYFTNDYLIYIILRFNARKCVLVQPDRLS